VISLSLLGLTRYDPNEFDKALHDHDFWLLWKLKDNKVPDFD